MFLIFSRASIVFSNICLKLVHTHVSVHMHESLIGRWGVVVLWYIYIFLYSLSSKFVACNVPAFVSVARFGIP